MDLPFSTIYYLKHVFIWEDHFKFHSCLNLLIILYKTVSYMYVCVVLYVLYIQCFANNNATSMINILNTTKGVVCVEVLP